jgi:Domain of unknown function (DUF5666)
MSKNMTFNPRHPQADVISEQAGQARQPSLRRLTFFLGVALLGIVLTIFVGGKFLASQDPVAVAAQSQNDLLSSRAYQFTGQGKIVGGSGATWIIGGVPIQVSNQTQLDSGLHPGDAVSVLGHISKDGKWLADRINLISEQDSFFSFGGPLEARSQTAWQVAGISLAVNDQTQLGASLQDNELVLATFKVMPDGTWLALNIESLAESATPSPTPPPASSKPSTGNKQIVSDPKPQPVKPAGKSNNNPGCDNGNGRGKNDKKHGKGNGPCSGSNQGHDD